MDMQIKKSELIKLKEEAEYSFKICNKTITNVDYLRRLENIDIKAIFYYDFCEDLYIHFLANGYMICPCALTGEDVEVPFALDEIEKITFEESTLLKDDAYYMGEQTSLTDILLHFLVPIIPIKVVKKGEIEYPKGDGWKVTTEAQFKELKRNKKDLRWAKLWDLKIDRED